MSEISAKYNLLDDDLKNEVNQYIEYLLKNKTTKNNYSNEDYKKSILSVSIWSDKDIEELEKKIKEFQNWKVENWS